MTYLNRSPRYLFLPMAGLLLVAVLSGLWVQGRDLPETMGVLGWEMAFIYGLGGFLSIRRSRAVAAEAKGWSWLGVYCFAGCCLGFLIAQLSRHPWLGGSKQALWLGLAALHQGAGVAAVASWPWQLRNARQRPLHILGSILFCGSLLLMMRSSVSWGPVLVHRALLDAVFLTSSIRVCLFGGLALYLLADRPSRWRGPLGWLLLNAVGAGALLFFLFAFWAHGVTWLKTPIFLVALGAGATMTLAALSPRPVEPDSQPGERSSGAWEVLPYVAFLLAALVTVIHFLLRPGEARPDVVLLALLLIPLLWRQMLLYREVRLANLNLEARVEARTRDLEVARTELLQEMAVRKRSEEELRRAFAAVEQTASSIVITDTSGAVEYVNRAFTDFTGYTAAEVMGQNLRMINSGTHPREYYEELWATLLQGQTWRGRFHNRHKDGGLYWEQAVISPVRDSSGRITHYVAAKENITEALRLEAEHLRMELQIAHSQKLESLGSLAGGVAHDMNNVLGAILAMASSAQENLPAGNPMGRVLDTISRAASRGGQMVKSLLNFARQTPAEEGEVELNAVLQEVVQLLKWTTLAKVHLELDLDPELRLLRGDADALAHAFMNLCVNAVDAMPGDGTLTLRTRNEGADRVEVQVRDTGSGMTAEVLRRALDPFFTTKDVGKGTGLGLAMVDGIVKAHRGHLELKSELGRGTCVTVRFPAGSAGARDLGTTGKAEAEAEPARLPKNLLVVDDDELMQCAIGELLAMLGHAATLASRGEAALVALEAGHPFDGVILDINMPGLGGAGTLHRLRVLRPGLPVLLVSGKADQVAMDLAGSHPGVTLLPKPFTLGQLQKQLELWNS